MKKVVSNKLSEMQTKVLGMAAPLLLAASNMWYAYATEVNLENMVSTVSSNGYTSLQKMSTGIALLSFVVSKATVILPFCNEDDVKRSRVISKAIITAWLMIMLAPTLLSWIQGLFGGMLTTVG